jgi:DNA-binding SARP family transcriptional activator
MGEVSLRRNEQLFLGVSCELRPTLAIGNPTICAVDRGHVASVYVAWLHLVAPRRARRVVGSPVSTVGTMLPSRCRYVSGSLPLAESAIERTRIQICGRLSVEIDGVQLAGGLRGKQVPLLLAYLLLNRSRHVGREELIGALWPERAPVSQDGALRTLLSRLRSALGASALVGRDELVLALPTPVWLDLEAAGLEVERARQALEHGDARGAWALAQVPLNIASRGLLPGSQALWLEPRRRDLEDVRLQALEVIGRAGLSLGGSQLASVQRTARSLIETEPYRESGYVLLMEALAAQGNVAEGLRVFDRLRTLLIEELGTTPSPETMAAHERLLRPGTRARPPVGPAETQPAESIELPAELVARGAAPLVGRQPELEELERLWAQARDSDPLQRRRSERRSEGSVALLTGDPGIGKTRLVAEIARRAHERGAFVLAGRSPQDALVPYQPFVEALRHYVLNVPFAQLRSSAREYGAELARLVPELRRRAPELPPPLEGEPETERYRLFEAVVGLLTEISASAPVLLVLDDLQWADRPTLLLLRHLARAPDSGRVLVLGSYRATETEIDGFAEALAELRRERLVTQIEVKGLAEAETAELVRIRVGGGPSRSFCRALHEETEGNPFFIEEIVRHLAEAGVRTDHAGARELQRSGLPQGVKDVIARRLSRLDEQALEWLRVAAVIGRDLDATLLERVVSLNEDEFLNALDAALATGLVVESPAKGGRYSFSHALIRETLYEGMSAPRRARIHRRVGEALETEGADKHLTALALHFTRAAGSQDAEKAIEYATRAGQQATEMLAHEEAAEHYTRALEVQERFEPDATARRSELLLLLGEVQVRAGERPLAWEALREAAALAGRLGDSASLARAAIGASSRYVQPPGVIDEQLIGLLEQALEMTSHERTVVRVRLLACLCGALYYSPRRGLMKDLSAEATVIAAELDDPEARALAAAARRRAFWNPAHLEQRLAEATELLTLAREAGDLELALQGHAWLVLDLLEHGDSDAVDAQIEAFAAGAQVLRQPLYLWNAAVWRAMRALLDGRLEEADALASEALEVGAHVETVTAPQYYAIQLLAIRREQDRMAELEQPARELVGSNPNLPPWRAGLATLLLEIGRADEARLEFEALAAGDFEDIPQDGDWLIAITLLADCSVALGDSKRTAQLYQLLLPYSGANVVIGLAAVCLGSAARQLGRLAAAMGRSAEAAEHFQRAIAANTALRAPVWLAQTQLDYAQLLGSGDRTARTLIDSAAQVAQQLTLPAVARRAAALRGS